MRKSKESIKNNCRMFKYDFCNDSIFFMPLKVPEKFKYLKGNYIDYIRNYLFR